MSALYIWNPFVLPDAKHVLELFITRGETNGIAKGTRQFAQQILESVGIEAKTKSWNVMPFRSKYFSEYLGEKDWRDNWQLIWRMRIETEEPLDRQPKSDSIGVGADIFDDSSTLANRVRDDASVRSLVIADFSSAKARDLAEGAVSESASSTSKKDRRSQPPEFSHARLSNGIEQLQIDLGLFPARFYSEGAGLAEEVMTVCKMAKGTLHFQQRPKK